MNRKWQTELLEEARRLDAADELSRFRAAFHFPRRADGSEKLYFCGHSLGLQPRAAAAAVEEVLESWRNRAVEGHFSGAHPWMSYHLPIGEQQAALTGALPLEVVAMNTLTVNLHLAMASFYRPHGRRQCILMESGAFPSDRHAVESQVRLHGLDPAECLLELAPRPGERLIEEVEVEHLLERRGEEIALVLWPGVQYATGQAFDLARITTAAHAAGAMAGFDLAHAVGNVPVRLHESGADFAAWCTYKYLNGGPGAIAGMFVHERHHGTDLPRLRGWYGNALETRFRMAPEHDAAAGAEGWVISNPPILSMAPLLASLALFREAGLDRLRRKSLQMSAWLAGNIHTLLRDTLEIITPLADAQRGCQLSLRVCAGRAEGRALFEFLESSGIVPDWREPDVIRVAPVPLYNRFEDCAQLLIALSDWRHARHGTAR